MSLVESRPALGPDDVAAAAARIAPLARRTPLFDVEIDGRPVLLKLEHLQRSGSFKIRGALNSLLSGPRPERVVTASGGNHGPAVAGWPRGRRWRSATGAS